MNLWVCVGEAIGGVFWSVFVRGKCIPGVVGLVGKVSINNLLTDWEGEKVVVLAANRRDIDGIIGN